MNTSDLKIALVQTNLFWKDKTANLAMLEEKVFNIEAGVDIIVLPEMFSTGFTMDASEVAEPLNLNTTKWMKQLAAQTKAVICGSIVIKDDGNYYNRFLWVEPSGQIQTYDKRHLFRMADEDQHYAAGKSNQIIHYKGWKILPQICYDLRFPVWSRNSDEYDILIFVANWPKPRISAWDTLLKARAIENMCYTIGVNRVGVDGNNLEYIGHSQAVDMLGEEMTPNSIEGEAVLEVHLDKSKLTENRNRFRFLNDKDSFSIE